MDWQPLAIVPILSLVPVVAKSCEFEVAAVRWDRIRDVNVIYDAVTDLLEYLGSLLAMADLLANSCMFVAGLSAFRKV